FDFFFQDPPTTSIYTLSLHDALPISLSSAPVGGEGAFCGGNVGLRRALCARLETTSRGSGVEGQSGGGRRVCSGVVRLGVSQARSEEHTSELQSRSDLVCRLLLEKKK